jgi:hypothetical protein
MNEYRSVHYSFSPVAQPIRYFKLTADMFQAAAAPGAFTPVFHQVSLAPGSYLSLATYLAALDLTSSDTIVLNFQVGIGKTEVQLDCVQQYANSDEYIVFYCAPFLRLLQEIGAKLKKRGVPYFDCTKLGGQEGGAEAAPTIPQATVHLMTSDFLLGSGGRKSARQAVQKSRYQNALKAHLAAQGKKVILFLDEIHEKTAVFDVERLPHLLGWVGLVHKVFIASATFTYDAVEVVKAVSFLTGRRISVFQADRVKGAHQARLHLHLCAQPYSERDLHGLAGLAEVIQAYPHRPFHLLAAFRNLAKRIVDDKAGAIGRALTARPQKPVLLTADNKTVFEESKSSVGTTFKTGVNITSSEAVLIAVLPGTSTDHLEVAKQGTFTDMRSSVVQAFARVRNGGDIHVFLPPFASYIHNVDFMLDVKCEDLLRQLQGAATTQVVYQEEQTLYEEFAQLHRDRQQALALFRQTVGPDIAAAYDAVIGFSSLYEYTIAEYPAFKDAALERQKQGLGPLILWMALQDQFTNCSLASVRVETYISNTISLPEELTWTEFLQAEVARRLPGYQADSLHEAIETILHQLERNPAGEPLVYVLNPRTKGLTRGSLRALYDQSKPITEAVFAVAESLVLPAPLKKSARFDLLVRQARPAASMVPQTQEDYFSLVQAAVQNFKGEVFAAAKQVHGAWYLPASFTEVLSAPARQAGDRLVEVLIMALRDVPLLRTGITPLPGYSTAQQDYWEVALYLLRQSLGILGRQPSREGRADAFGKQVPHYKLPVLSDR